MEELTKYKLGEIAKIYNGSTPSTLDASNYDGDIIWATPKDLSDQNSKYFSKGARNITQKGFDSCSTQMIPANNILMSSRAPIGLFAINTVDCCTNQGFKNIVLDKAIADVDFMYYFLKYHVKEIEALGSGTTFREVSKTAFEKYEISIPSLPTQQKIASVLSKLDRKISVNREINRNLEELAKQIYDYWFVQFDFPNEDGKPYKSSGGKMVWNETLKRNIPEGWEVKKVDELAEIQKKQITPKENIEYKHYSLPNFDKYESYSIENGNTIFSDKFFVESGNLLISKLNPWTDRTVWVDDVNNAICSTEYVVLKQNDKCIQSYLNQIAHTQSFIDYCTSCSTGTSHSHRRVKPELMTGYKVPFQENIVKAFGKQIYPIIKKKLNIQNENRNLIIFRDELLPLLMNGQVTLNSCLSAD